MKSGVTIISCSGYFLVNKMSKFYGKIGYVHTVESPPNSGIYKYEIVERNYYGDVVRNNRRLEQNSFPVINDNVTISNSISILADPYAMNHYYAIRYVEYQNCLWKVTSIEEKYPRLICNIGGLYNGESTSTSSST